MPSSPNRFCLSRAEGAHFEPMHGYRDWLRIRDLMEYSEDIEIFELASPADHSCVDV